LKIEADRKLKEELMKETFDSKDITCQVLNSIKNELNFRD